MMICRAESRAEIFGMMLTNSLILHKNLFVDLISFKVHNLYID